MDGQPAGPGQQPRRPLLRALPATGPAPTRADLPPHPGLANRVPEPRPAEPRLAEPRLAEPRVAELDALLRDVEGLRATLRRDLELAATAVEADAGELADYLLGADIERVQEFGQRALHHVAALDQAASDGDVVIPTARRRRRMLPAVPLVAAAAAVLGFLIGVVPGSLGRPASVPSTSNAALSSYATLAQLASTGGSAYRITVAAQQLHADLAPLVATASTDPSAAENAIALLTSERAFITAGDADSPALQAVLLQADALLAQLRAALPRARRYPLVATAPQPTPSPTRRTTSTAGTSDTSDTSTTTSSSSPPKPSTAPSPTPSAAATASPRPTPTPSPSSGEPLPYQPGNLPG